MGTNLTVDAELVKGLVQELVKVGGKVDKDRKWAGGDDAGGI